MKKLLVLVYILFSSIILIKGQNWNWSNHFKCDGNVVPTCVIPDNSSNIYIAGYYINFPLSVETATIQNLGDWDGFIAKFNMNGALQWITRIGGTERDEIVSLVIVGNNLYVAGNYRNSTVYFTPTDSLINENLWDSFLARYDLNGNYLESTIIFHGNERERIGSMIFDSYENQLIIVAQFRNEIKYNDLSGPVIIPARGSKDFIIAKSDFSGIIRDTSFFYSSITNSILKNINLSQNEGYFVSGDLFGTIYFNASDSITGNTTYNADALVFKINKNLDFQWARKGGGLGYDHANSGISDKYGNVYIAGKCESTITFDSTAILSSHSISGFGAQDLFLAKYNKLGTLRWIRRKGDAGNDDGFGLAQRENLVQFCGNVSGTVIFNVDTLKTSGTSDVNTGFAIFNTSGNEIGAQGIGGTGLDRGEVITFTPDGNTVIGGYFDSPTINIGDSTFNNSTGTYNGFIGEYHYPLNAVFTTIENITCNGGNDGSLIVTPYFGVGPYNYLWSANVTSYTDSLAFNLSAGNYSVTVTDSRDSTAFTNIILSQPSAITIDSSLTHVTCYNGNNASIDITVSGGTVAGNYQYSWQTDIGSGLNPTAADQTGLTYGNYFLAVMDDNSCEAFDTFTINQPDKINFGQSVVTNVTIPPGGNGAIDLTVSGGTPAYSYSWTGPGTFSSTDEDISNLDGGTYIIQVTDFNTCTNDTSFLVNDSTLLIAYISNKTNVDCKGNFTGSATVSVTGGSDDYTYAWRDVLSNPVGGNDPVLSGVPANTYFVLVTDNTDARTAETSVIINEPTLDLTSSISGTDLKCYNDGSGVANLSVSGGTLPYYHNWSNGATSEDLINLQSGTYSVTITDANGCIDNNSIFIDQPEVMAVDIIIEAEILCNGDLTGRLRADVTGGTGMLSYLWNDPGSQDTKTATDLEGGNYTVTVTDQSKCKVTNSAQLVEPLAITITESIQDPACFGLSDGQIIPTVSGGTAPFDYVWSTGWTNRIINNIEAGDYTLTVTDHNNCTKVGDYTLTDPPQITFENISLTDASCFGYDDGSITMTASGGTGTYEYSNNNGATYQTSPDFITLFAGDYTLIAKDENDCESADSLITINQPDGIDIQSEEVQHITCMGDNNGAITIVASGGAGSLLYSINDGADYFDNSGLFTGLIEGEYPVRVIDADNCEVSGSVLTITTPDSLVITSEEVQNITCNGYNDGTIIVVASGGTGTLLYSINDGTDYSDNGGTFTGLSGGNYNIKVRDASNCEATGSVLTITEPSTLTIDTTSVIHMSDVENGSIILGFSGGTEPVTYILIPETTDSLTNNTGQFNDLEAGNYIIYALDNNACISNSINVQILQIPEPPPPPPDTVITIYDAFSPNADGKNDVWNIGNIQAYPNCVVKIFNSWGMAVFDSKGYDEPWDGKHNGNELPAGTYYYYIDLGDGNETFTGTVNIVK